MPLLDSYSIVIVGAMNPRIHHPLFYKTIGIAREEEAQAALDSPGLVCLPQLAQLTLGPITIVCLPDRWQATTNESGQSGRLLDIAVRVSTVLEYTPTSAFAFNFDLMKELPLTVSLTLGGLLRSLDIGLPDDPEALAGLTFVRSAEEADVSVKTSTVIDSPVDVPNALFVKTNVVYQIKLAGQFDLGAMMKGRFEKDQIAAKAQFDVTAAALERKGH